MFWKPILSENQGLFSQTERRVVQISIQTDQFLNGAYKTEMNLVMSMPLSIYHHADQPFESTIMWNIKKFHFQQHSLSYDIF